MAKVTGFSQLTCDRCGAEAYAVDGSPTAQSWRDISRVDQGGQTVTRLLCPACYRAYRDLVSAQDTAFSGFMANQPDAAGGQA